MLRSASVDHEALIFLHIPKTAGTTLNRIIEWQYSPLSIFTIDPQRIRATPERFKTLSAQRRRQLRVVRGHMVYGIHKCLPQGAMYITMLRDPVARLVSAYSFILRRPLNPMHRKLKRGRVGVEAFIRLTPNRQNLQCRMLAGVEDVTCDQRVLDVAKENITKSFSVVGLCERFEESLVLIAKTFGWEIPYYENRKVSKVRPALEPSVVNMIQEHNRFDMELYEFARKRFEDTLHKEEDVMRQALAALESIPKPGPVKKFCHSTVSVGRFLVSKIASAI
jgi:Sulfotransferase family